MAFVVLVRYVSNIFFQNKTRLLNYTLAYNLINVPS